MLYEVITDFEVDRFKQRVTEPLVSARICHEIRVGIKIPERVNLSSVGVALSHFANTVRYKAKIDALLMRHFLDQVLVTDALIAGLVRNHEFASGILQHSNQLDGVLDSLLV